MSINIWFVLFCQQKTAYEMRISDWSSDVCSSDLSGLEKERTRLIAADKGAAPGAAPTPKPSGDSVDALHALILHQLDEDQAQDIISIPLAGKSSLADHMVIATGRSTPIGRASCGERVCQYVELSVVAVSLKKKKQ